MQCRSVYWFIMSFIIVLFCSEYAIEALKVTMSVCLSIARCIHNLRIFDVVTINVIDDVDVVYATCNAQLIAIKNMKMYMNFVD